MTSHHAKALREYREREVAVLAELEPSVAERLSCGCEGDGFGRHATLCSSHPRRNEDTRA